jgi:hypothetical protein
VSLGVRAMITILHLARYGRGQRRVTGEAA